MWKADVAKKLAKTTRAANNFCNMSHCRCLTGFWMSWFLILNIPKFWICQGWSGSDYAWTIPQHAWIRLDMPKYAWICMNMPKSASMAFLLFPIIIPCLPECMINYFNVYTKLEVMSEGIQGCFPEEIKLDFFCSSWKYLICFRLNSFARFQITLFNSLSTKWISKTVTIPPQKALWTSLKLSWKVKNCNANYEKKIHLC